MKLTYTDGRNWLPNGAIAHPPPIPSFNTSSYQIGFSLARLVAEYWTAKTIRVYGSWAISNTATPWAFDQFFNANKGRMPAQRVIAGSDYLQASSGLPLNRDLIINIDWTSVYKIGDLYYPYIAVQVGATHFTSSSDEGGSPSNVTMTAFGQTLACQDFNGSNAVGSVTIETTAIWT